MKAAQWLGTRMVEVGSVPKPSVTDAGDAIVRITHCSISGSDLHIYEGELNESMHKGDVLGHEAVGIVDEVGPQVESVRPGDRVIVLPVIACGRCEYCLRQEYALCDTTNPSAEMEQLYGQRIAGTLGYSHFLGGYAGSQAEFCRVPHADLGCVKAPADVAAQQLLSLADATPTAWHGCELAQVGADDVVGVWGCGPVGLSVQRLARLRGAKKVFAVDKDPRRLQIAEAFGMVPVDVSVHPEVADFLLSLHPAGLDRSIEASGFRSTQRPQHAAMRAIGLERDSCDTVAAMIKATRKAGNIALVGDFFHSTNDFPIGLMMEKALTVRGGRSPAQKYHPFLLDMILHGRYDPSWMFTHEDAFENIADEYRRFSRHETPGALKVCLATRYGRVA